MGYRSSGMIYIPESVWESIDEETTESMLTELNEKWEAHPEDDHIWTFEYWKWYGGYPDVDRWERFVRENPEVDLIVIGEDNAIVSVGNQEKFYTTTTIGIHR